MLPVLPGNLRFNENDVGHENRIARELGAQALEKDRGFARSLLRAPRARTRRLRRPARGRFDFEENTARPRARQGRAKLRPGNENRRHRLRRSITPPQRPRPHRRRRGRGDGRAPRPASPPCRVAVRPHLARRLHRREEALNRLVGRAVQHARAAQPHIIAARAASSTGASHCVSSRCSFAPISHRESRPARAGASRAALEQRGS